MKIVFIPSGNVQKNNTEIRVVNIYMYDDITEIDADWCKKERRN